MLGWGEMHILIYGNISVRKHRNISMKCIFTRNVVHSHSNNSQLKLWFCQCISWAGQELGLLKFYLRVLPSSPEHWRLQVCENPMSQGSPTTHSAPRWGLLACPRVACRLLPVRQQPQQTRVTKKLVFPEAVLIISSCNSEQQWTQTRGAEGEDYWLIILANYSPFMYNFVDATYFIVMYHL